MSVCRKSRAAMAAGVILVSGGCARHAAVAPPAPEPTTIRMRGTATIASDAQPLIVINGVVPDATYHKGLNSFDPNEFESIEIVKGGPAVVARYGEAARHGVILIRTRDAASCPEPRGGAAGGRKES